MNMKELILFQLANSYYESGWFVCATQSLAHLTEEQTTWRSNSETNSIRGIVEHLIFYNTQYLREFLNEDPLPEPKQNSDTFNTDSSSSWNELLQQLDHTMSNWKQVLEQASDETIENWIENLSHLNMHTSYHVGQIIQIRKQQQSWDPKWGVH
ncbi:DinB family protein [Paenibacillus kyungheensis]